MFKKYFGVHVSGVKKCFSEKGIWCERFVIKKSRSAAGFYFAIGVLCWAHYP